MLSKVEADHNFEIDVQVVPDDQHISLLQMKKASGELPDIMTCNVPHMYNIFDPETELYDFSGEDWVKRLALPEVVEYNGKIYSFPMKSTSGYQAVIYNKDFFEDNNLSIPQTPEEFENLCITIKGMGVTPILMASERWVPQIWATAGFARAMGSDEKSIDMTEKVFSGEKKFTDYPELIAVLDYMLSLKANGYVNDDLATLSFDDAWGELSDQKGAMLMGEGPMIGQRQVL